MKNILIIPLLCICCLHMFGQKTSEPVTIAGTVYDEKDITLPGASVYRKDRPGVGTATDNDGKFTLKANIGDHIIFSFMGYETYELLVSKAENNLVIKMEPKTQMMDEAIVTGMGTQRKISIAGAITNVDVKDLQTPATSIPNMLGGRVPGIISLQTSGEPGKNISEFWVRGIGTFGANDKALVLIDGLEGNLSRIDPADIESFSVLKDASATAVYGVRGANGVIIVTTKRGSEDKLRITGRVNMTVSNLTRMPEYVGAYEYAKLANEARVVRGNPPLYNQMELDLIQNGLDPDLYPDVNWQDETLNRTSLQQTYYVNARGGGSVARYYLSLGMSNESAAYKQDKKSKYSADVGYKTYNYRVNLDVKMTKTTDVYFGADGFLSEKAEPGNANTDLLWKAQQKLTPLTIPTKYSTGHLPAYGPTDSYSPYVMLNYTGMAKVKNFTHNVTLAVNQDLAMLLKGLTLKAQLAYSNEAFFKEVRSVMPEMYYAIGRSPQTGGLSLVRRVESEPAKYNNEQNQYYKLHFESTANYSTIVNKDHRFSGLAYFYMSEQQWANWARKDGNSNNEIEKDGSMRAIPQRYQGLSGRFTYGLKDTYFVDLNFGYTGSENFQKGRRFGFFPSVAAAWVPSSYEFVKEKMPWIDFFKIRGSYGTVGNDRISDRRFPYLTIVNVESGGGWGSNNGKITESQIGADNLNWEKAKKIDVGIEGKFLNNRISFVVDFFRDQRDRIFQQRTQIPDFVGLVQMPYGNVGKMKSYGSDGNIEFTQNIGKDMSFTVRGNFTYSKNKVQNWEEVEPKYPYQTNTGWAHNVYRGYIALGLFKDEDDVKYSPQQKVGNTSPLPGDIKYKDVNGDGIVDGDDKVPISYSNFPRLMYGFGGEFRYKKLTVGVLFKGTGNTDFYHAGNYNELGYIPFIEQAIGNVPKIVANQNNRWTPASYSGDPSTENPNARFPRLTYGGNDNNNQASTFWQGNSRYLRLQEVNVNYNLTGNWMKRVGLSSVDIQFVGSNLLIWDSVKLWDPEQADKNGSQYPIPARYAIQLYLNF
ncbi:TonB-dependent receptor [Prevotella sp. 10(H)]|uniref:SusC/RagA family TonB-linked outer membrane protein n=1 Tax=Prevotella sp. 10(H) TaxID=1158294 RepID=UPI0004A71D5E|nr:TonB-dependent receptor [Prevotella sp. 10(H)]